MWNFIKNWRPNGENDISPKQETLLKYEKNQTFHAFYFFKKICRFLYENLMIFTGKSKSSNVPVKTIRFFYKNRHIFQ